MVGTRARDPRRGVAITKEEESRPEARVVARAEICLTGILAVAPWRPVCRPRAERQVRSRLGARAGMVAGLLLSTATRRDGHVIAKSSLGLARPGDVMAVAFSAVRLLGKLESVFWSQTDVVCSGGQVAGAVVPKKEWSLHCLTTTRDTYNNTSAARTPGKHRESSGSLIIY